MRGTVIIVVVLLALLALASLGTYWTWQAMGDVEIGLHGLIALGLGVGVSLLLGIGLMSLVFFSHRRGYDDEAGRD